jgi:Rv2525c-like, glycoside hydrolase-like domain
VTAPQFGIDYSYGDGLTAAQMREAGVTFVCRYLCYLPNGKVITKAEYGNLVKAGIAVVLVWEYTGRDAARGRAGGAADAREANRQALALGAPAGCPVYFAPVDYNALDNLAVADAYLDGAGAEITVARVGGYGDLDRVRHWLNAGKVTYAWQTYAWSRGLWEDRAHIRQYRNAVALGPASVDFDQARRFPDFGQAWPRPAAPSQRPVRSQEEETMWLPETAEGIPVAFDTGVDALRFFSNGSTEVRVDWVGVDPDPGSRDYPLGYGAGEVDVNTPAGVKAAVIHRHDPDPASRPAISLHLVR